MIKRVRIKRCPFRKRSYALNFGGAERGTMFQWLGLSLELTYR